MKLKSVLQNRIAAPLKAWHSDARNHNGDIGFYRFASSVFHGTSLGARAGRKVQKKIYGKLFRSSRDILERYRDDSAECVYDSSAPVWVFWMQGYESAPVIVKKCFDSIKAASGHPVHLITSDNLFSYYDFPSYIREKYADGVITNAQFSDILRMTLLSEYGGLWIDATIFIPRSIPEEIFRREFFTCKRDVRESGYVSGYRWTSFLNGCQKGCVIQRAAKDLFFSYWEKNDYLIDYLLVDYVLLLIYENLPKAKKLIDELPFNNPLIEELQNRMNSVYDEEEYRRLINDSDTYFFKLSWRIAFSPVKDSKQTFYGKFLEG